MLTAGAAHLQVVLASDLLKLLAVSGKLGQLDVDGGAHSGAKVGGAESEEAQAVVVREGNPLLNLVHSGGEAAEDLAEITAHLHGDDAEVILLVDPDKEGLVVVVVDATAGGPVAASVGGLQEAVTLLEEEVVVDQLLLDFLAHASEGVVGTLELALKARKGRGNLRLHLLVLRLSEAGVEGVTLHGATAADAGGDNELALGVNVHEGVHITEVLVGVLVGLLEANMVVLDDGVEEGSEEGVGLGVGSIDTNTRVQILHTWGKIRSRFSSGTI